MVDILLGVTAILRGVSGATVVATDASTDKLFPRKRGVGTRVFGRGRRFRYFPVGVVSEEVAIIRGGGMDEGKVKVSG